MNPYMIFLCIQIILVYPIYYIIELSDLPDYLDQNSLIPMLRTSVMMQFSVLAVTILSFSLDTPWPLVTLVISFIVTYLTYTKPIK